MASWRIAARRLQIAKQPFFSWSNPLSIVLLIWLIIPNVLLNFWHRVIWYCPLPHLLQNTLRSWAIAYASIRQRCKGYVYLICIQDSATWHSTVREKHPDFWHRSSITVHRRRLETLSEFLDNTSRARLLCKAKGSIACYAQAIGFFVCFIKLFI